MTTASERPAFYNDLNASLEKAWLLIEAGAANRNMAAHTPVVATIDRAGQPQQRVMVLRAADRAHRSLRFHSDARSAKIAQTGAASVLIYEPGEKLQLRLTGSARADVDGAESAAAWERSTQFARRCYMAEAAPGSFSPVPVSGLPAWIEGKQPTDDQLRPYRGNFGLFLVTFDTIEYLYLANTGHRRARWTWDEASGWSGNWLVP
jgi:pyridoxamine 5'-phosphate oxidase